MADRSHDLIQAALLLAIAKHKPDQVSALDFVDLLSQPNVLNERLTRITADTRLLAKSELARNVGENLGKGQDLESALASLQVNKKARDVRRQTELEQRVEELEQELLEKNRKLCQAELEVRSLFLKQQEATGNGKRKQKAHKYQKAKAAEAAKAECSPFEGETGLRERVEFLELVRLLVRSCGDGMGKGTGIMSDYGDTIATTIKQTAGLVMENFRRKIELLQMSVEREANGDEEGCSQPSLQSLERVISVASELLLKLLGFASTKYLLPNQQEELIIVFSSVVRQITESIYVVGQVVNDIRLLQGTTDGNELPENTTVSEAVQKPFDLRQQLCNIIVNLCKEQTMIVPSALLVMARGCAAMASFLRPTTTVLPKVFSDPLAEDQNEQARLPFHSWQSPLARDNEEYATASALDTAYYYLLGLDELLKLAELNTFDSALYGGLITEKLAKTCYSLLEDCLVRTPLEYSTYAFRVCIRFQELLGRGQFCVDTTVIALIDRCLRANRLDDGHDIGYSNLSDSRTIDSYETVSSNTNRMDLDMYWPAANTLGREDDSSILGPVNNEEHRVAQVSCYCQQVSELIPVKHIQ
ncbi:uncharacterized protein SPPG_02204 [Spizellomyces punctatus DAOM BR117]|uniref:Uncharacterized protein n=1 Tax=Spizellomyces punctatus (strain DAOM BR117) TaxID=645134 RepID=A0A0L0HP15_SPIPD|nr:uncharacterized protein SPPG_02204 [Spizellomyces punctatus DAOM BR117]KND03141.1 hypothetical protein SPPG_02204 [Spizellomyces punctatus DAOM BR117]|eukprot:XP_016611180.1 hypothetical protein SPPG_02204 [Spizellomyces punctatus DAOM BR117]